MNELVFYKKLIDQEINRLVKNQGLSKYSLDFLKRGKRIRPILTIKSYEAFKNKDKKIISCSIAPELIHASTLIHDDIMDEDIMRRGKLSVHSGFLKEFKNINKKSEKLSTPYKGRLFFSNASRFATSLAIMDGNILVSLACKIALSAPYLGRTNALSILLDSYRKVNIGQINDVKYEFTNIKEKEYFDMIKLKTGELFAASLEYGAVLAKTTMRHRRLLRNYGINLACAFQIHDDLMDLDNKMKKGNTLGSDIKKGKNTLFLIKAKKHKDSSFLKKIVGNPSTSSKDIIKVKNYLNSKGIINQVRNEEKKYIRNSLKFLKQLKPHISKDSYIFFENLTEFVITRKK